MKKLKYLCSIICAISLCLMGSQVIAYADTPSTDTVLTVETDNYRIVDGVLKSVWDLNTEKFEIPEGVTEINSYCFHNCSIETLVLPSSLKAIRYWAFYDDSLQNSLSEIICKSTQIEAIEDGAFYGCKELAKENGLLILDNYLCFSNEDSVPLNLEIPEGVEVICGSVFEDSCIESVKFPSTLKRIGERAFYSSSLSGDIVFPDGLCSIGENAFMFTNINSVNIPKETEVSDGSFSNCNTLKKNAENFVIINGYLYGISDATKNIEGTVVVPEGVKFLAKNSMQGLKAEEVVLPDTLTGLGYYVFSSCYDLKKINMPDSVTKVGGWCFSDCKLLADECGDVNIGRICFGSLLVENSKETVRKIPDGVEIIAPYAFANCKTTEVELPSTLRVIGEGAFSYCSNLTLIELPEGVERVEAGAFGEAGIKSLTLPSTVKFVGFSVVYSFDSKETPILTILSMNAEIEGILKNNSSDEYAIKKIVGLKGSTAEAFCIETGIPFEEYQGEQEKPSLNLLGDVDGSGIVTAEDALCILKNVVGLMKFDDTRIMIADCDRNERITAEDALWVLKKVVGLL